MEEMNYFSKLNGINVNDKVEKKNGLSYLSWPFAWSEVKKLFPDSNYTIYEAANGCFYHTDGKTCWVKTGVTVNGIEHIEYLPVMDHRNKSIPLDSVTSFDVNKTIQRSLTKAVARHGLGLYVYAGEDLPEDIKTYACECCGKPFEGGVYKGQQFTAAWAYEQAKKMSNGKALCKECRNNNKTESEV